MRALIALLLLLPAPSWARTWNIQEDGLGDAPTIQAGIDSAAAGDSVLVHPGTYYENIDFVGKAVVVKGSGPKQTTINGGGLEKPCVQFMSGEGRESILEGFKITNGRGFLQGVLIGGGVFIDNSQPTIRANQIRGNSTMPDGSGGGVFGRGAGSYVWSPLLEGNIIEANAAGVNGGGLGFVSRMAPIINDNEIVDNTTDRGDGAGIWLLLSASGSQVYRNKIMGNIAGDHAGGIMAVGQGTTNPTIEIYENLILDNTAEYDAGFSQVPAGGAIWLGDAQVWLHNNTIVRNRALNGLAGGIGVYRGGSMFIERNIIALTEKAVAIHCETNEVPMIQDNLAWENVDGKGGGFCADWWQSNGNLVADPYFCNAEMGDYTLAEDSPALTHPAGPLGAFPDPGCGPVPTIPTTWGQIKARYHSAQ